MNGRSVGRRCAGAGRRGRSGPTPRASGGLPARTRAPATPSTRSPRESRPRGSARGRGSRWPARRRPPPRPPGRRAAGPGSRDARPVRTGRSCAPRSFGVGVGVDRGLAVARSSEVERAPVREGGLRGRGRFLGGVFGVFGRWRLGLGRRVRRGAARPSAAARPPGAAWDVAAPGHHPHPRHRRRASAPRDGSAHPRPPSRDRSIYPRLPGPCAARRAGARPLRPRPRPSARAEAAPRVRTPRAGSARLRTSAG